MSYKNAFPMPPIELLRQKYELDAERGVLIRKQTYKQFKAGEEAGYVRKDYLHVKVAGKSYPAHRIIYFMMTGVDPKTMMVDHINGHTLDNRIVNLRLADIKQNGRHRVKLLSNNTSGHRNVHFCKSQGVWVANVLVDGKSIQRNHKTKEAAAICAAELRAKHYGEFAGTAP